MVPTEDFLRVGDTRIHLFLGGRGRLLVILHGAGGGGWLRFHDLIARRFTVYARVHLLGTSLGGWIAAEFAVSHQERLSSLTLGLGARDRKPRNDRLGGATSLPVPSGLQPGQDDPEGVR